MMLGERASVESLRQVQEELGLDKPLYVQYGRFMSRLARGDLGRALKTNEKITTEIAERFPATIELSITAMLIATIFGMAAGIISATSALDVSIQARSSASSWISRSGFA